LVKAGIGRGAIDVFGEHPSERFRQRHLLDPGHRFEPLVQQFERIGVAQPVAVVQEAVVEKAARLAHGFASSSLAAMKSASPETSSRLNTGTAPAGKLAAGGNRDHRRIAGRESGWPRAASRTSILG
jgi:hypothetical protein